MLELVRGMDWEVQLEHSRMKIPKTSYLFERGYQNRLTVINTEIQLFFAHTSSLQITPTGQREKQEQIVHFTELYIFKQGQQVFCTIYLGALKFARGLTFQHHQSHTDPPLSSPAGVLEEMMVF